MYSLSRAPSKLAARASNRGISQQIENFEGRSEKSADSNSDFLSNSAPRPIFRGKKANKKAQNVDCLFISKSPNPRTHNENVNLIAQEWLLIKREISKTDTKKSDKLRPRVYKSTKSAFVKDFVPFNIDEWWMNRTLPQNA